MPSLRLFVPAPAGTSSSDDSLTVQLLIDLYLRHLEVAELVCPDALAERKRALSDFADAHGHLAIGECLPYMLTDWIEGHQSWRSPSTRRTMACRIHACFNWAATQKRIAENPFAGVTYEDAEPRPVLPDADLADVLEHANERFFEAVWFLRLEGCRLSDLCRMDWPNVDWDRGVVTLDRHKAKRKTKKPKVFVLVAEAIALLVKLAKDAIAEGRPLEGPVFRNNCGRRWNRNTLGKHLRRLKGKFGIETEATLHGIRHNYASVAILHGAPLTLVSKMLGHSSTAITEKNYVHIDNQIEAIREAAKLAQPPPQRPPDA
jgi:integrase